MEVVAAGGSGGEGEALGQILGICMGVGLVEFDECVSDWGYAEVGVGEGRSSAMEPGKVGVGVATEAWGRVIKDVAAGMEGNFEGAI